MHARYGIDTSILVRLLTGDPPAGFAATLRALTALVDADAEIVVSNQVIGEAYVAVQHHYGVAKADARAALVSVLQSGLVAPQNGASVIVALQTPTGCGLVDRLIADDHRRAGLVTLTLDRRMAALPDVRRV
jgi:predicted nucleic acid-binding protein